MSGKHGGCTARHTILRLEELIKKHQQHLEDLAHAQAALRARKLVPVLPGWRPVGSFGEQLYAIRPYSPYVPRAVHALVAHLRLGLQAGFGG